MNFHSVRMLERPTSPKERIVRAVIAIVTAMVVLGGLVMAIPLGA